MTFQGRASSPLNEIFKTKFEFPDSIGGRYITPRGLCLTSPSSEGRHHRVLRQVSSRGVHLPPQAALHRLFRRCVVQLTIGSIFDQALLHFDQTNYSFVYESYTASYFHIPSRATRAFKTSFRPFMTYVFFAVHVKIYFRVNYLHVTS